MSESDERCLMGSVLPGRLADLASPPERLFLHGELPRGPAVAVVGTRHPSDDGRELARKIGKELAQEGVAVLSGGAEGIDTEAHLGALDAGGATVVVAPAGFEHPFPAQNAGLFQRIVREGGAYLSLRSGREPAHRSVFFPRNACLVALAHVVVVVERPFRSGAANAAAHARRLGRPLFVVPHSPSNATGRGCLAELQWGARCYITTKDLLKALAEQNLHALPASPRRAAQEHHQQESLKFSETSPPGWERSAALSAVEAGATSPDEIGLATGLAAGRVSELILTLRLEGVLVTDPSGRLQIGKQPD